MTQHLRWLWIGLVIVLGGVCAVGSGRTPALAQRASVSLQNLNFEGAAGSVTISGYYTDSFGNQLGNSFTGSVSNSGVTSLGTLGPISGNAAGVYLTVSANTYYAITASTTDFAANPTNYPELYASQVYVWGTAVPPFNVTTGAAFASGGATAALQSTGNASLATIATNSASTGQAIPTASATGGASATFNQSALAGTVEPIKSSAGQIFNFSVTVPAGDVSGVCLEFFNTASGSVSLGTTPPFYHVTLCLAGTVPTGIAIPFSFQMPMSFSSAISYACVTTYNGASGVGTGVDISGFYQ